MNEQYYLTKEIPLNLRIETYQKAIQYYEYAIRDNKVDRELIDNKGLGLCVVLPVIFYDLPDWEHNINRDENHDWYVHQTRMSFIEINDYLRGDMCQLLPKYIPYIKAIRNDKDRYLLESIKIRIQILNEILSKLNN